MCDGRKGRERTFSSTASLILFNTHTIHPLSITSATNPNSHLLSSPSSPPPPPERGSARATKKNSKNHLVTNKSLRLSFSVIFGRSDLMSFRREDRNAVLGGKDQCV